MYIWVMNLCYSIKVDYIAWMIVPLDIGLRGVVLDVVIIVSKVVRITIILDDRVVEYNTCFHDHTQFSVVHVSSNAMRNGEASL